MPNDIFREGWVANVLIYGFIYLLAQYAVYKIIFRAFFGSSTAQIRRYGRGESKSGGPERLRGPSLETIEYT